MRLLRCDRGSHRGGCHSYGSSLSQYVIANLQRQVARYAQIDANAEQLFELDLKTTEVE